MGGACVCADVFRGDGGGGRLPDDHTCNVGGGLARVRLLLGDPRQDRAGGRGAARGPGPTADGRDASGGGAAAAMRRLNLGQGPCALTQDGVLERVVAR